MDSIYSNSNHNSVESVSIKYLTKGHTHMSADGVHANIETKIRKLEIFTIMMT